MGKDLEKRLKLLFSILSVQSLLYVNYYLVRRIFIIGRLQIQILNLVALFATSHPSLMKRHKLE